jgi:hypothetical protein
MMPEKPQEIPHEIPEEKPLPIRVPGRPARVPGRPSPAPSPSRPSVPSIPQRVPAGGVTGAMGLRNRGDNILSQLREFENDVANPSGNSKREMDAAIRHIAKRNMISEEKVRRRLRQSIMRERRSNVLARAAKARGKSELSVYVSISEKHDLEVKSGLQVASREIDLFQVDIHPSFIFDVKTAIDAVGDYYGFNAEANEGGVQITGLASVSVDGVNALVNAISEIEKQQPLEVYELVNFGK